MPEATSSILLPVVVPLLLVTSILYLVVMPLLLVASN